ncbi:L-rhamnose mutarotase [Dyadobacter endophyticus]|nr:L-rhamnose mutarotase [Dyadobacter endophyticus]
MNVRSFKRFCKTMELREDIALIEAYKMAHKKGAAWPEITQGMKEVGILDMEIYLSGTKLFMIMDCTEDFNHEQAMIELARKPRQNEWEQYMSEFQATTLEASADQKWHLMEQIYKME